MYHRFNENKYPSTNIKMDVFKEHMEIIKKMDMIFIIQNFLLKSSIKQKKKF